MSSIRVPALRGLLVGVAFAASGVMLHGLLAKDEQTTPALTETLGGADRYLTYVSTDKPIYRPGQRMYVRAVVLHHATGKPLPPSGDMGGGAPAADRLLVAYEIRGPKGDVVQSGMARAEDSVAGIEWQVPAEQAGGQYTIKVTHPMTGWAPAERKFEVRAYRAPRLRSQVKFVRDGYGPGDEVVATLEVSRAEGGVPEGAAVTIIARVDGEEAFRGESRVDAAGNCVARFALPNEIVRGEGTLAMVIEDGGVVETASKTIPILLQTVDLTMFPEGGDLVAGLESRVYIEAFTPARKPADLAGVIVDAQGNPVASLRTEHEGRGQFTFTPKSGETYRLKITEPAGIATEYPLPEVKPAGAVLSATQQVIEADAPARLRVAGTQAGKYTLTLRKRDVEIARQVVELQAGRPQQVEIKTGEAEGVLIATLFDAANKPLAERLVFRRPAKSIQVRITADAAQYVPGGKVKLTVETTDQTGEPTSAVVGLTVTDDSVLEMIERREQAPRLPVMVLLENDVRELADAHVYFDPENEQAPQQIDLLLGTQGWRRFALVDLPKFLAAHGDAGQRMLALKLAPDMDLLFSDRFDVDEFEFRLGDGQRGAARDGRPRAGAVNGQFGGDLDGIPEPDAAPAADEAEAAKAPAEDPAAVPAEPPPANLPVPADGVPAFDAPAEPPAREQAELADALRAAQDKAQDAEGRFAAKRVAGGGAAFRRHLAIVRVYAHQVREGRQPGQRQDFTETLFWHAGVRTDQSGKAEVEFGLSDAVTSFRASADAIAANGALGSASTLIESVEPFYVEPKLPLEVTAEDVIQIPIGLVNATGEAWDNAVVLVDAHAALAANEKELLYVLAAQARARKLLELRVGRHVGAAELTLAATAGPYGDRVTRSVLVKPLGFPVEIAQGGLIAANQAARMVVTVPADVVRESIQVRVVVYPSPVASMTEALERLIREPYGCFEQTSSTTYPLVMAQQYFLTHQGVDPALVHRAAESLTRGYERLIGFECKSGGFEWFGNDPGHDALTAYGLMQFTDMAQVRQVERAMLERTRAWLLTQRDGKGGFERKTHTLHTWLPDPELSVAYNVWALLEAGVDADLSKEVASVREAAERTDNTYVVALAANVMMLAGEQEAAARMLDKLAGKQDKDGSLSGSTTSVVGSGGEALAIETTSLAVLAWLRHGGFTAEVERSIQFLAESCKAGRFGSTQSTVLALKAIIAYNQARSKPKAPGRLQLVVNGKEVGEPVAFDAQTQGALELPCPGELLSAGKHTIQVRMIDGCEMPYSISVDYHSLTPDSSDACKVRLEAKLRQQKVEEGAVTEAVVTLTNRTEESIPTPMAIIGIPGGLEVRHDQLKELVKAGKIAAYEVLGRDLVLYWRAMSPSQQIELPISLTAAVPGTYTGPASRAYLYYTDEHKQWLEGLKVTITPRQ